MVNQLSTLNGIGQMMYRTMVEVHDISPPKYLYKIPVQEAAERLAKFSLGRPSPKQIALIHERLSEGHPLFTDKLRYYPVMW